MPRHCAESRGAHLGRGAVVSLLLSALVAVVGLGVPVLWRLRQVLGRAGEDAPDDAEVLLVLGRALIDDRPSPAFAARLDHGRTLWAAGRARRLMIAGGLTGTASRSEAAAGRDDLVARGVPAAAILVAEGSRHTLENLYNVRATLRADGWRRLTVVSDPLHLARVAALGKGLGLDLECSPAWSAGPAAGAWRGGDAPSARPSSSTGTTSASGTAGSSAPRRCSLA